MPVISVQLKGINANREDIKGEVKIKNIQNNIVITDVRDDKIDIGTPQKTLVFTWSFKSDYITEEKEKKFGTLEIKGDAIYVNEEKELLNISKAWKKNKKLPENVLIEVLQSAFEMAEVEAIYFSRKVMLPSPIELPRIKPQGQGQGYIG